MRLLKLWLRRLFHRSTRPDWDTYFLRIAAQVATRGDCSRRQVGALVVSARRIISTGYNGVAPGEPGCLDQPCERVRKGQEDPNSVCPGYSDCRATHAEANALLWAGRPRTVGATLYITENPCSGCWKLIRSAGITKVVTPHQEIVLQRRFRRVRR